LKIEPWLLMCEKERNRERGRGRCGWEASIDSSAGTFKYSPDFYYGA
jgi:hypothetical protein